MMPPPGSKHLVNAPETCVADSLRGLVAVNTSLQLLAGHNVVVRRDVDAVKGRGQVTIVSGGGSGHEPAFAGYVGPGMLTAAVCGAVFASPSPASVLAALRTVGQDNTGGTLLVILNYTGDRLNFGLAVERARASGLTVEMVVVGEDCALTAADKTAGRRGLAGTIMVLKVAGAMAEEGRPLKEIAETCTRVSQNMGTIGLSVTPCSLPGQAATFTLAGDEMELGLGVHGEAGVRRLKLSTASDAVDQMLSHLTLQSSVTRLPVRPGATVALMVNNLGGSPTLEVNIVAGEAVTWLEARGLSVTRVFCGPFLTSLEMAGVSLTVLYLDDGVTAALDATTSVIGWSKPLCEAGPRVSPPIRAQATITKATGHGDDTQAATVSDAMGRVIHKSVSSACEAVVSCEAELNTLDRHGGDGDCGATLKRGAQAILSALGPVSAPSLPVTCPHRLLLALSQIAETAMGGSSGGLYSLFLAAAARSVAVDTSPAAWCEGLRTGISVLMTYGGAEPGDRTMLDSLDAAHQTLARELADPGTTPLDAFGAAVLAAETAAVATSTLRARAGRASYVTSESLTTPDPGAHAVGVWLRAAYQACKLGLL